MSAGPAKKRSVFDELSGQRNLLGRFQPKGFIRLRDAIEQLGSTLIPDWSGEEQIDETWDDETSLRVLEERENWLADWIAEICLEAWGDRFRDAAADYQTRASTFSDLIGYKQDQAILRSASERILRDARRKRAQAIPENQRGFGDLLYLGRPDEITDPPLLKSPKGVKPINLDVKNLKMMEREAVAYFAAREKRRSVIRRRTVQVWELLRRELHAGTFECVVLKEGAPIKIEPAIWATDGAQPLFRECVSDGSEIFVSDEIVSLSRSGSEASASETNRLDREGAGSTGGASAPPEFVPTLKRGRPGTGDRAATVYERRFPGGHEVERLTLQGACDEIAKSGGPMVSPKTLTRALKKRGIR